MNLIFETAQKITKNKTFNVFIFFLILFSAIIIGIETYPEIASKHRFFLAFLDKLIISCFVLEIGLKIISNGKRPWNFFSDPWNVFDFVIVAVCLIPAGDTHFFAVSSNIKGFKNTTDDNLSSETSASHWSFIKEYSFNGLYHSAYRNTILCLCNCRCFCFWSFRSHALW